jgi:hypothetical protein
MNGNYKRWARFLGFLTFAAAACLFAGNAQAQQKKTVEHIPAGPHQVHVTMHHSTVMLVAGNHLVVRRSSGVLEALEIPEDFRFHMDGRTLSVHELQPGMIVTETVTSTTKPIIVKTVVIDHGTVWSTQGENVVIRDKHNKLNEYRIPSWVKIDVGGVEQSVLELQRGMVVSAKIITEEPIQMVERETKTSVRHPVQPTRPKVAEQPPVQEPAEQAQPVEQAPAAQPPATELPKTASPLPLIGLLGFFSLAVSFGLRMFRKFV